MSELTWRRKECSSPEFPKVPQPTLACSQPLGLPLLWLSSSILAFCYGSFIFMLLMCHGRREGPQEGWCVLGSRACELGRGRWAIPLLLALPGWSMLGRDGFFQGLSDLKKIRLSCTNVGICFSEQKQTMRSLTPMLRLGRSGCETVGSTRGVGTDLGWRHKLDCAGDQLREVLMVCARRSMARSVCAAQSTPSSRAWRIWGTCHLALVNVCVNC